MLPVDILPAKKESEFYRAKPTINSHAQSFTVESEEVAPKKRGQSFMIEDILGDSRNKRLRTQFFETPPPPPCSQCLPSPLDKESASPSVPTSHSDQHSFVPSPGSSRLVPSTAPLFIGSLSPAPVQSRFGFCYSPAIASSPPFSFSNRSPEVFTFLPSDYNEHMQARCFRQENALRSPLYSPSAILDLSNYVAKSSNARVLQSPVITLQNTAVECPGGRQIIWKHISRNPAKRKGGQIRFTNDQTTTLESTFSEHKYLSSSERKRLATALRLSERQVKTWFQNRRAKWRRIKQEPSNHVSSSESEDCNPSEELIKLPNCEPTDHRLPAFK